MEITIDTTKSMDEIIKQVEEAKSKQEPKRWRANSKGFYFFINSTSGVARSFDGMSEHSNTHTHYEIGNYFKTREEAVQEARLRDFEQRVAARIKELNGDRVHRFHAKRKNHTIEIKLENGFVRPCVYYSYYIGQRGWWSDKLEVIEQVIKEFGADNFIKWAKGEL